MNIQLKEHWNNVPEKCREEFGEAIQLLMFHAPHLPKGILEEASTFLTKVIEPTEPDETITMEEFISLPCRGKDMVCPGVGETIRLQLDERSHKLQCEHLKVGDTVFFLTENLFNGSDGIPNIDISITRAKVVEEK